VQNSVESVFAAKEQVAGAITGAVGTAVGGKLGRRLRMAEGAEGGGDYSEGEDGGSGTLETVPQQQQQQAQPTTTADGQCAA